MTLSVKTIPGAVVLLLAVVPGIALSQHSASASQTLRFGVLPVHSQASAVTPSSLITGEVTVSVEPASGPSGVHPSPPVSHMLLAPGSLPLRPPRGSTVILTITE